MADEFVASAMARLQRLREARGLRSVYAAKPLVPQRRLLASAAADQLVRELRARHGDQAIAELERACAAARRAPVPQETPATPEKKPKRRGAVGEEAKKP